MVSPEGVSSLNESKDTVGVDVVGIGESVLKDDALEGQNMGPAGLCSDQSGIKDKSAVIIQGGDEIPCLPQAGISLGLREPRDDKRHHVESILRHNGLRPLGH